LLRADLLKDVVLELGTLVHVAGSSLSFSMIWRTSPVIDKRVVEKEAPLAVRIYLLGSKFRKKLHPNQI
jgi:hypothetical protein